MYKPCQSGTRACERSKKSRLCLFCRVPARGTPTIHGFAPGRVSYIVGVPLAGTLSIHKPCCADALPLHKRDSCPDRFHTPYQKESLCNVTIMIINNLPLWQ